MRICPQCGKHFVDEIAHCSSDGAPLVQSELAPGANARCEGMPEEQGPALGTVLGSYKLVDLLGEGGMGRVYVAEHIRLGRRVALKLLQEEYASNPAVVRRFFSEARAVNQLRHENIIEITDFTDYDERERYYIMELLEGETLCQLHKRLATIPVQRLLPIIHQVCDALAAVHDAGMVHRDLKPENIFVLERGGRTDFVKLMDFGVVKLMDLGDGHSMAETAVGAVLGTPAYMSPEQVSGAKVDYRTDIYALGVILFEMLAGRRPFAASGFGEMVVQHLTVEPPRLGSLVGLAQRIPPTLDNLVHSCLAKAPEQRPQSMRDVRQRLQAVEGELRAQEAAGGGPDVGVRRARPRWVKAAWLGVSLAATAAISFGLSEVLPGTSHGQREAPRTPDAGQAESVQLTLESTPTGAQVFAEKSREALGTTPLSVTIERSSEPKRFRFTKAGYREASEEIVARQSMRVLVRLEKVPEGDETERQVRQQGSASKGHPLDRPTRSTRQREVDRRGTLDPFADQL